MVTEATAALAWAFLLAVARCIAEADRLVRAEVFPGSRSPYLEGQGVTGKTRGPLVDERALVRALTEGRIAGAVLDVFEREPCAGPEVFG